LEDVANSEEEEGLVVEADALVLREGFDFFGFDID